MSQRQTTGPSILKAYFYIAKAHLKSRGKLATNRLVHVNPAYKVGYYETPKVLSTSITRMMVTDAGIPVEKDMIYKAMADNFALHSVSNEVIQEVKFTFAFVRNPFARLVSLYKDKVVGRKSQNLWSVYSDYMGGILRETESFADFAYWVSKIDDTIAEYHFISQYTRLYEMPLNKERLPIDFIGKFESVVTDWAYIQEKTGLPDLGHFNQTAKDDWRDYYDLKTAELVYQRYQKDVEAFGYEKAYQDLLAYLRAKE